ncbi:MAG: hypothetical protein EBV23_13020 [Flavobacteriia bacterium]|nr:hypothetical protein [Flavobacteriia bacterium]
MITKQAVIIELSELAKLGMRFASLALRKVEAGRYDGLISGAVDMSVSDLADLIIETEAVI